jgi:hypothetical protein
MNLILQSILSKLLHISLLLYIINTNNTKYMYFYIVYILLVTSALWSVYLFSSDNIKKITSKFKNYTSIHRNINYISIVMISIILIIYDCAIIGVLYVSTIFPVSYLFEHERS